jgi:hypothetical protein
MAVSDNLYPTVFGVWRFSAIDLTLQHKKHGLYSIELKQINTTAQMLDWIFQINQKNMEIYGDSAVKDLIKAFFYIFRPQANCCSYGLEKSFNGGALAATYAFNVNRMNREKSSRQKEQSL